MTARGFVFLMTVAVLASVVAGKLVEGYTAPGIERTVWFAIALAAVMYPAGIFAERRGWIRGKLDLSKRGRPAGAGDPSASGEAK